MTGKFRSLFWSTKAVGIVVALTAFATIPSQSGAPPERTGAPGDGTGAPGQSGTCSDVGCHNSFDLNSGPGSVTINSPAMYVPGETVAIQVSVAQANVTKFGFEITAKDDSGAHIGSWVLGPNTRRTIGNSNYLTHSVITESEWTFGWQSPIDPVNVTFYAAGNAADGKVDAAGDYVYTTSKPIVPNTVAGVDELKEADAFEILSVYPNPSQHQTTVLLNLAKLEEASVSVYDLNGRRIANENFGSLAPGRHELAVNLGNLPSGLYAMRVRVGNETRSRPLTVVQSQD
ncbi:MAG: T9SS type A sorting domain-containing protein [Rhodothermales bacterium]|nr:T9SS type A sorting domain-containing protein [Rhodothermales bacterium]